MGKIELRDEREPGYFTIDNEIVDELAPAMGPYGIAVYVALCRFANRGVAFPSLDTIATRLDISRNTVKKALDKLVAAKVIHIQHRPGNAKKGISPQSSIYSILKVKKTGGRSPHDLGVGHDVTEGRSPHDLGVGHVVTPNKPNRNKTNLTSGVVARLEAMTFDDRQVETIVTAAAARGGFSLADCDLCEQWLDCQRAGWDGKYGTLYNRLKVGKLPILPRTNGHHIAPPQPVLTMEELNQRSAAMRAADPEFEARLAELKAEEAKYG